MKLYIASRLENRAHVSALCQFLREAGHIITYDWTVHGSVRGLGTSRLREVAENERDGVMAADVLIALLPGGRGTHVEIGLALGREIPVLLLSSDGALFEDGEGTCAFYWCEDARRFAGEWREAGTPAFLLERLTKMEDAAKPAAAAGGDAALQRLLNTLFPPVSGGMTR